ncbi:SprT family zinc-dependent metalloprotease [Alteromonas aestuariivivens]|uniref:SprT family zinc-dependent metalloprotease n=1 Tax=Alteromonas aestuariivivens TaxID=1938339 RepID=A0A3D8M957_9ALTE|nr:SprT family zinc-dependent metalloprotease [Alteromonas aestuariivivens]RDV26208.1 SprT family zinc-dependent metalloprotease [Alteromonas aestuariivivens]
MSLTTADKNRVIQAIDDLYHLARQYFNREFPRPAVTFRRSGKNAGTAFLQQNRINFHPTLLQENLQAYFNEVIPHEVSHLLAYQLYGRVKPHGAEWKYLMLNVFNVPPQTTHNFDLSSLELKSFHYSCNCGVLSLGVRRHNNILRGQQYKCRRCQAVLTQV